MKNISKGMWFMIAATFTYALLNLCVKKLSHIPPAELVFFRSVFTFIFTITYLSKAKINPWGNNVNFLLTRGIFGVLSLLLFFYTLQTMPMATVMAVQYLSPVFTAIIGVALLGEVMLKRQWVFLLISLAGILVIKGTDSRILPMPMLAGIGSALFSALAYSSVRQLANKEHPLVIVLYFPIVAIPVAGTITYFDWVTPYGIDWLYILLMSVFTQMAQTMMTMAIQKEELTKISYLNYLGILYALIIGYLVFGEDFAMPTYLGMSMVLVGVLLNVFFVPRHKPDFVNED